jgi:hypothetical protein
MQNSKNKIFLFSALIIVITLIAIFSYFSDGNNYLLVSDSYPVNNSVAQYHRVSSVDTTNTDWNNITFDTIVESETTNGYSLTDANSSILINYSGIVKFQGKVTILNNATSTESQRISLRILNNGVENRCTQTSSNTNRISKSYNTIIITGTSAVEVGDVINLQYRVDDIDLDIAGDPYFDMPVAVSLNLEKIN